jgi:phytoene/squalene synthetase
MNILAHHNAVARQHALFVQLLPEPLRAWTIGYYLLFRMIDTIEDAVDDLPSAAELLDAVARDPFAGIALSRETVMRSPSIPAPYRALFEDWSALAGFLRELDPDALDRITATARVMAAGMRRHTLAFQSAKEAGEKRYLADMVELDDYCHVVAGCVGVLSTRLFILAGLLGPGREGELEPLGDELGRYLQCVNILRDHATDMAERGRSHVPRSLGIDPTEQAAALIAFARGKETACLDYLAALPKGPAKTYCGTLFRIARVHLRAFARDPRVLERRSTVPAWRVILELPPALQYRFLLHKLSPARPA